MGHGVVGSGAWGEAPPPILSPAWLETRQLELPVGVELQIGEPTVEPAQRRRVCGGCGASESPGLVFQACSRCRRQHYCTKDCQVRAWKAGHKGECVAHP